MWDLIDPMPDLGQVVGKLSVRPCLMCGTLDGVVYRAAHTMYPYEGDRYNSEEDPNRPEELCDICHQENAERWDEMWKSYYSGCL